MKLNSGVFPWERENLLNDVDVLPGGTYFMIESHHDLGIM